MSTRLWNSLLFGLRASSCRPFHSCHRRVAGLHTARTSRAGQGLHTGSQWSRAVHHRTPQHNPKSPGQRTLRWYSGGGGGGSGGTGNSGSGKGTGSGGSGKSEGGGNFFQNFAENFRKAMKGSEVQDSLKGFHEEREKMQQSYVVQQAKVKWSAASEWLKHATSRGSGEASEKWSALKEKSSKVYQDAADTELGKRGQEIGIEFVKGVQKTAEEVAKTDVGQTVKKGSEVVREDLIDEIVKESAPYKPPKEILKRSDLASDFTKAETKTYTPNEDAKGVVRTKQESKWKQQLKEWRENNPISNAFYSVKTRYDESDHLLIRASRMVTDKVEDLWSGAMTQSDMAEALAEIHKIDPSFNKEEFVQQCKYEIIPSVLEAFMQNNQEVLKDWCHEGAFSVLSAVMKQRHEPGVKLRCKVLEVRDIDVLMAKVLEQGPVMVLGFRAQQLTRKLKGDGSVDDEILEDVMYIWALCRDQNIYDPRTAWRVLEFGIQSAGKMLV